MPAMSKYLHVVLNLAGAALLFAAAFLAWNAFNPDLPAIPSDVTVVSQQMPPPPMPPAPAGSGVQEPAPILLPDEAQPGATTVNPTPSSEQDSVSVATATLTLAIVAQSQATTTPDDAAPSAAERKANDQARQAEREGAFPPPAQHEPTRIVIPTIHVDSQVKEVGWTTSIINGQMYSEWQVADYAVSFHKTSALPGAVGNTVMSGHNNINGEVFKNLVNVKMGENIFVYADNRAYEYAVQQILLLKERDMPLDVRLQNAQWIAPTQDDRLTLVSCWPYTSNTHRVIVVAKPVS
jgi:sortase A